MDEGLISRRYAKALFKYAGKQQFQRLIYQKMKLFQENYAKYPGLQRALMNPMLSAEAKEQLLSTAVGIEAEGPYLQAIRLLIHNHREMYMRSIALMYQKIYREAYGIIRVDITTATEMSEDVARKMEVAVKKRTTKSIEFVYKIDPSIIGGVILQVGDRQMDASVRHELMEIRTKFMD